MKLITINRFKINKLASAPELQLSVQELFNEFLKDEPKLKLLLEEIFILCPARLDELPP